MFTVPPFWKKFAGTKNIAGTKNLMLHVFRKCPVSFPLDAVLWILMHNAAAIMAS